MIINSLDPRVTRAQIKKADKNEIDLQPLDQFETFEVFQQNKRGAHHVHVGTVHAPDEAMALLWAKEQYGRRGVCVNLWVVKTRNVFCTDYEDEDIFSTVADKHYREASDYKVMDRIKKYKEKNNIK